MPLSSPGSDSKLSDKLIFVTPETLVADASILFGSWQTVNSTTLNTANARIALLTFELELNDNDGEGEVSFYARETGSAEANDLQTLKAHGHVQAAGMGGSQDYDSDTNTFLMNLDSSSDFDYYADRVVIPDSETLNIILLGYAT